MKEKGNLSKAFDELLHGRSEQDHANPPEIDASTEVRVPDRFAPSPSPAYLAGQSQTPVAPVRQSEAIITSDMVIRGSITSASNISVFGTVLGDVTSESDMMVSGRIEGNVSARSLQLVSGTISGDITAKALVEISQGASVNGNIVAERISVDSRVTGNLIAAATVRLNANACIDGNIKASALSVQEGAELKGNLDIRKAGESTAGQS